MFVFLVGSWRGLLFSKGVWALGCGVGLGFLVLGFRVQVLTEDLRIWAQDDLGLVFRVSEL